MYRIEIYAIDFSSTRLIAFAYRDTYEDACRFQARYSFLDNHNVCAVVKQERY